MATTFDIPQIINGLDTGIKTYTKVDAWNSTPPSGASSKQYTLFTLGNMVILTIATTYATPGVTNTTVRFPFPDDAPTPANFTTLGSNANEHMWVGFGGVDAAITNGPTAARVSVIKNNANNGYEILLAFTSTGCRWGMGTVIYFKA